MLPRFAIVRFPSDNSLKIARTEWIADLDEAISSVEQMDFNEICVIQWPDNSKAMVENDLIESNATNLCDVYLVEFGMFVSL